MRSRDIAHPSPGRSIDRAPQPPLQGSNSLREGWLLPPGSQLRRAGALVAGLHACSVVLSTLISPCCLPGALMRIHGDDMGSLIQAPGTFLADSVAGCTVPAVAAAAHTDDAFTQAAARGTESLRASLQGAASSAPCSLHSSPQALSGEAGDFLPGASCVAQVPRGLGCARLVCGAVRLAIPLLSPHSSSEGPSSSVLAPPPPPGRFTPALGPQTVLGGLTPGKRGAGR